MSGTAFSNEALAQVQQLDDESVAAYNDILYQESINQSPAFNTTVLGIGIQTQFAGAGDAA